MKRGLRFVRGGGKELVEKLGRGDPCRQSTPTRLGKKLSGAAASPPAGFDGSERDDYWRE